METKNRTGHSTNERRNKRESRSTSDSDVESSDEAVSERSLSDMCDEVEVKHVLWQDAEDSDSDEEDEDYNPREKQAVKYFRRCYLDWEIPSVKNINHHTLNKRI